ncbi:MAG: N-acetylmuramoyl-L-alanine amidase [Victivallaceae bacterium]|nr:N-acetylmuramoyl-L-alanine amidase [Victivallaceae bacterium]
MKFRCCFYALSAMIFFAGCQSVEPEKAPIRYSVGKEFAALPLRYRASEKILIGESRNGVSFRMEPGKTLFCQDCRIALPDAVSLDAEGVYHTGENTLRVLRALLENPNARHFGRRILVDPGHGGKDTGAKGAKLVEKEVNLLLGAEIVRNLNERGFSARLSRETDVFYTLPERVAMAESCDLFISVHHNASLSRDAVGIETFAPETPRAGQMESFYLAFLIQRNLVRRLHETDRGVKSARFFVLERTKVPAVLLEAGFLSNAADEDKIADPRRRREIAVAVADALVEFYRVPAAK